MNEKFIYSLLAVSHWDENQILSLTYFLENNENWNNTAK